MFHKILIANRGEIACRVMRTCRRLGIASVAVYSEADASARHVAMADEAYPIGPPPARESYLRIDRIVAAARASGAEAVHPGYGFLSENADFAEACAEAGLVFVGPPPAAIRAMGSKAQAKALMEKAGVPLVPGYHGAAQDEATLHEAARQIGFPVLIKASAGGGGKGMRVVETEDLLGPAISAARREAASSFGEDRLLIEKYLTRPRHIEIQVFADTYGQCVYLFERDCSIQRRHQKVIEEAPAPHFNADRRAAMGEAAVAACRAVGYVGAGTVEFIVEGDAFYFMEMNTRLQVEHPVTEMITGQELVEWQLRVAAGERLPCTQTELAIHGAAIEVRIYAEDPAQDFRPAIGRITHLLPPRRSAQLRIDTGVRAGDSITQYYDPMIAKLIVHGEDRAEALSRLRDALAGYEIAGIATNLPLLRAIAASPDFAAGVVDTGFIPRNPQLLVARASTPSAHALAVAFLSARQTPGEQTDDPFAATDGWALNLDRAEVLPTLMQHGATLTARLITTVAGQETLILPEGTFTVAAQFMSRQRCRIALNGVWRTITVLTRDTTHITLLDGAETQVFTVLTAANGAAEAVSAGSGGDVRAPLPARVVRVQAELGQVVTQGETLAVVEVMKMEIALTAPSAGTVAEILAAPDDMVAEGAVLVRLEQAENKE